MKKKFKIELDQAAREMFCFVGFVLGRGYDPKTVAADLPLLSDLSDQFEKEKVKLGVELWNC